MELRAHESRGPRAHMPMGMQVMGPYGADKKVLEFALAYEGLTDLLDRRPELVSAA